MKHSTKYEAKCWIERFPINEDETHVYADFEWREILEDQDGEKYYTDHKGEAKYLEIIKLPVSATTTNTEGIAKSHTHEVNAIVPDGLPKWTKEGYRSWQEWAIDCYNAGKKSANDDLVNALMAVYTDIELNNVKGGSDELNVMVQKALSKATSK